MRLDSNTREVYTKHVVSLVFRIAHPFSYDLQLSCLWLSIRPILVLKYLTSDVTDDELLMHFRMDNSTALLNSFPSYQPATILLLSSAVTFFSSITDVFSGLHRVVLSSFRFHRVKSTSTCESSALPPYIVALSQDFFGLFVCCYKTPQSLLRLLPWTRSKTTGSISIRTACPIQQRGYPLIILQLKRYQLGQKIAWPSLCFDRLVCLFVCFSL